MSDVDEFLEKIGTEVPEAEWKHVAGILAGKLIRCPHCKRSSILKKKREKTNG